MIYKIPFCLPGLNEYIRHNRTNKYAGNQLKRNTDNEIMLFLHGKFDGDVKINFTWYEPDRRKDIDNVAFAKKFILDAMQKKGVLRNDKQVKSFTDQFIYGQGEGVEIEVIEL